MARGMTRSTGKASKAAAPKAKKQTTKPAAKATAKAKPTKVSAKKPAKTVVKAAAKKPAAKTAAKAKTAAPAHTNPALAAVRAMTKAVAKALDMNKAEEIVTIDLTAKSAIADFMIVATGRNSRQVAALGRFAEKALYDTGAKRCRVEGLQQGDWVVVDSGDVIVHLFRPEVREFYQLEKLWTDEAAHTTSKRSLV